MVQLSLGIDIGDDLLSGVALAGSGREAKVLSCAFSRIDESIDVAAALPIVLKKMGWENAGPCNVGLPLSDLSLRNLSLPFTDKKKIEQILPLELEEELLFPVDQQIIATVPIGRDDSATKLLTTAVEKRILSECIGLFDEHGIEPDRISPGVFVLTDQLCRTGDSDNFLLLYCDLGSITMVAVHQGIIVFMRRHSYAPEVFTEELFSFDGSEVRTEDPDAAEEAVNGVCEAIQRSLDYFTLQHAFPLRPEYIVVSGPMHIVQGFQEKIQERLGLPVQTSDLVRSGVAVLSLGSSGPWLPAIYDRPLALALQAGNRRKNVAFNFRKDEFASSHQIHRFRKKLIGAALTAVLLLSIAVGYFVNDYNRLNRENRSLSIKMEQIFKESFPDIDPGRDPLMHMRSKLNEMDTVTVSMPIFSQEQRILVILADISARIPQAVDLHVTRLNIDRNSVTISGTTNAFNNVYAIQDFLKESERYEEVNIVSANKGTDIEGIRFEIKLQLATGENA